MHWETKTFDNRRWPNWQSFAKSFANGEELVNLTPTNRRTIPYVSIHMMSQGDTVGVTFMTPEGADEVLIEINHTKMRGNA